MGVSYRWLKAEYHSLLSEIGIESLVRMLPVPPRPGHAPQVLAWLPVDRVLYKHVARLVRLRHALDAHKDAQTAEYEDSRGDVLTVLSKEVLERLLRNE